MTQTNNLQELSKKINANWNGSYSSLVQDGEVRIKFNHEVVALVDSNLEVEILDEKYEHITDWIQHLID